VFKRRLRNCIKIIRMVKIFNHIQQMDKKIRRMQSLRNQRRTKHLLDNLLHLTLLMLVAINNNKHSLKQHNNSLFNNYNLNSEKKKKKSNKNLLSLKKKSKKKRKKLNLKLKRKNMKMLRKKKLKSKKSKKMNLSNQS
jgi:hypothetical protein